MRRIETGLVGLIGFGAQEALIASLIEIPTIRIAAAFESDAIHLQQIHRFMPDIATATTVSAMLDSATLDALVLAGAPDQNREISVLAMQRGISVFVQNAPCSTLSELQALVAMARQCGVRTGVAGSAFEWQRKTLDSRDKNRLSQGFIDELHRFFEACGKRIAFDADFESLLPTYRSIEAASGTGREMTHAFDAGTSVRTGLRDHTPPYAAGT